MRKTLDHRYARNLSHRLSVLINFRHFCYETNAFNTFLFIDPLTFLEIKKDHQIDSKTYLLFASKRKEITRRKILVSASFKRFGETVGSHGQNLQAKEDTFPKVQDRNHH